MTKTIESNAAETKRLLEIAVYYNTKFREQIVLTELELKKLHSFAADNDNEIAKLELEIKNANV